MAEKKELNVEELDKVSGGYGYESKEHAKGYWFTISGQSGKWRYLDSGYGYLTGLERDNALDQHVLSAINKGVTDIRINKGYL